MKRAYQICYRIAWIGFILIGALWLWFGQEVPVPFGFVFLPFTALSATAAILNRLLPEKEREKINLGFRGVISHPYLDVLLFAAMNAAYFLPLYEQPILPYGLVILYALLELIFIIRVFHQRHSK